MATSIPEEQVELRVLRDLVTSLGRSHRLYLVGLMADERRDVALAGGDLTHAHRHAHDAKLLADVALRLLH